MRATGRLTRALAPVLVAALAVGMAACGSSAGTGAQAAQPSSTLDALSTDQLAAQAAKEGSVTWYTTFADDDVQPMVAAFNKIYPNVKVNALRLSADQIPARIITEQRGHQYSADVVSGDSPQIAQLLQAGVLQPYTPKDLPPLPSGLSMPSGYQGIVYLVTTVIAYNPTVVKQKNLPVPTSWEDLTKPAWKGQFSIDPGAVNWYDSLIKGMGHDQALALLKALGANKPVFVSSHTQAITDVEAGEPAAAATAYGYKSASEIKKNPNNLDVLQLESAADVADTHRRREELAARGGGPTVRRLDGFAERSTGRLGHHQPHVDPYGRHERRERVERNQVAPGLG